MNVLIVFAHPEPKSLNGALKDVAVETITAAGHEVKVSDLYAQKFKAVLEKDDFTQRMDPEVFNPIMEQYNAVVTGSVAPDAQAEIDKVAWADLIIFQFPIWWTSMPAILKGWIDRVFVNGFAFNAAEGKIYADGLLKGKKAMLSFTTGAPQELYSAQGPHGDINQLLTYITHGMLEFVGMEVLPSFGLFGSIALSDEEVAAEIEGYKNLLKSL